MLFIARTTRIFCAFLLIVFSGTVFAQQSYPNRPITLIVPYGPGNSLDVMARLIAPKLSESLGQQVVVEARPGASGTIGTESLARSKPDGHTLILVADTHYSVPLLLSVPYDPVKDFAPVATLNSSAFTLLISPSVPASNLQEFIALAKSRPKKINVASSGFGSASHLASEWFAKVAGVELNQVVFKGSGEAITALAGGHVDMLFAVPSVAKSLVDGGRVKAVAVSGDTRTSALPGVPTFKEAHLPDFNATTWTAILAPAGTPKEIITKLSSEITRLLNSQSLKDTLTAQGIIPFVNSPDQFADLISSEMARYAKFIKDVKEDSSSQPK